MNCSACDNGAAFIIKIEITPRIAVDLPTLHEHIPVCLDHLEDTGPLLLGWRVNDRKWFHVSDGLFDPESD